MVLKKLAFICFVVVVTQVDHTFGKKELNFIRLSIRWGGYIVPQQLGLTRLIVHPPKSMRTLLARQPALHI